MALRRTLRTVTRERWPRVKSLFSRALSLSPSAREQFLLDECKDDPALFGSVRSLLSNDMRAGDFLDSIPECASTSHCFSPGQFVSERFRIIRLLGKGGMGEVYEAEDTFLGDHVALKTISSEISQDPAVLTRFRTEIQLARRITHPNVCRIFHIELHRESPEVSRAIITMELLLGETLAERLDRTGRLPNDEALSIAAQIASALEAAHSSNVVHRDLKPGNVFVVPREDGSYRAVVTDFGLAKDLPGDSASRATLTGSQALAGTLDYMAPEQLRNAQSTFRSDIYSFGMVLFEMVTGNLPFQDESAVVRALRRLREPVPSPSSLRPDLDRRFESVILRCLAHDPERRFGSAREIALALHSDVIPVARRFPISRRSLLIGISTAIPVALFPVGFRYFHRSLAIREGATVLMSDVDNSTGDADLSAVTEILRNQLEQSPRLVLIERNRIEETLRHMVRNSTSKLDPASAREVAWRNGADVVVFTSLSRLAQGFELNIELDQIGSDPRSPRASAVQSFHAPDKDGVFAMTGTAGDWIRKAAGESATDLSEHNSPAQDTTTPSWEALRRFSQAERLKAQGKAEGAMDLLQDAIRLDPDFALAWARLGDLANSLGRDGQGFEYWKRALAELPKRRLSEHEELRIRGLYAADAYDFVIAEQALRAYDALYPNDFLPSFYLSTVLWSLGRSEEAIQKAREAERKSPGAYYASAQLARIYISLSRLDAAAPVIARVRQLQHKETADILDGAIAFLRVDYLGAEKHFRALDSSGPYWQSQSRSLRACLLAERGRYSSAFELLREGLSIDTSQGYFANAANKWLAIAYLHVRRGDRTACRDACLNALSFEAGQTSLMKAGALMARCGLLNEAQAFLKRLQSLSSEPIFELARRRVSGELKLAREDTSGAIVDFRLAAKIAPANQHQEYLARALIRAGDLKAAIPIYRRIVNSPGEIWRMPEDEFPGFWTDMLFQYAVQLHHMGYLQDAQASLRRYIDARSGADSDLQETELAKQLLQQRA